MKRLSPKEFSEKIRNKYVLFDTGVIIRAFENFGDFESFFKKLEALDCSPTYFPFIEFEFIRGAFELPHRQARKDFLRSLAFNQMPFRSEMIEDAIKIANSYAARKLNSPSLIDCCIGAYLKQYSKNLFLVTLNHKDFPTFLFDRIFICPIDTEKEVFPLAFYQFNLEKGSRVLA